MKSQSFLAHHSRYLQSKRVMSLLLDLSTQFAAGNRAFYFQK